MKLIKSKLKDVGVLKTNKANNQCSIYLRKKDLKKIGMTTEDLLNMPLPKIGAKI